MSTWHLAHGGHHHCGGPVGVQGKCLWQHGFMLHQHVCAYHLKV